MISIFWLYIVGYMDKPKYLKVLLHLNKLGPHIKHNISQYLIDEFGSKEKALEAIQLIKDEGYIIGDIYTGSAQILAEEGDLVANVALIGNGLDRINKINALALSRISIVISLVSIIISIATFVKAFYTDQKVDKYKQEQLTLKPEVKQSAPKKKIVRKPDSIHKPNHIVPPPTP
jgi:hypothetical protein